MKEYKSVLLLRIPFCPHPDAPSDDDDFRNKDTFRPVPSLALASLCSFFEKYKSFDYTLKAVDINIEAYSTPQIAIDRFLYHGLLEDCIRNNAYDVLGISVMLVYNIKWVDDVVKLSRKYHPDSKIIIGGGYPTLFPEMALTKHDIAEAIIGEGEATLLHLLNKYNNHHDENFERMFPFDGYATRDDKNEVIIFPRKQGFLKMEMLPPPNWKYLNVEKYFRNSGDRILPIEGSRGCPYNCSYCCTYISWGRKVRYKAIESLTKEIINLKKEHDSPSLHFVDDNMSFSKQWIMEFLTKLIDLKLSREVSFSNFSVNHLDEEIMDLLVKAGVKQLAVAVESGSPEIQKCINKKLNFDKVKKVVKMLKEKKFYLTIGWMLGFPNETLDQINETLDLVRELRPNSNAFNIVLPYPGTKLFNDAKFQNLLNFDGDDLDNFGYRKSRYVKSNEWDYAKIKELEYDATIEMTYLNNPFLDDVEDMDYLIIDFERRLRKLPGLIIAHIVLGYIYNLKNRPDERERHYGLAIECFKDKMLFDTFYKYLAWDHPIIKAFNRYLAKKGIRIDPDWFKKDSTEPTASGGSFISMHAS